MLASLAEKLLRINDCHFNHKELEELAKNVLSEEQAEFFKEVKLGIDHVMSAFNRI
jgi:hypothetical protein